MDLREGDTIEIPSNKVEQPARHGTVERILDEDPMRIEVAWDDGHRTIFMPAAGNVRVVTGS